MNEALHIMVVDDDSDDIEFLRDAFSRSITATRFSAYNDGKKALDQLQVARDLPRPNDEWPNVILLDLNMPRIDGFSIMAALKSDEVLQTIPVMVISSTDLKAEKERCFAAGCARFFGKPMTNREYDTVVAHVLDDLMAA